MKAKSAQASLKNRQSPLDLSPEEFRKIGHKVIDEIANFLDSMPRGPVTKGENPPEIRHALGAGSMPETGASPDRLLQETANLLWEHSLFNGHPRFWGYITSSASSIGALADLLAASVNPNVGAWMLSPMASEIEAQTIRWIAELIGYPAACGGILVSGGNMANFVGFLAARTAKAPWAIREEGLGGNHKTLAVYCSRGTHTWIEKVADLFGLGTNAIRWIEADSEERIDAAALEKHIVSDRNKGLFPFLVIGSAGTVGTGAVDALHEIAAICKRHDLWFHADGAYGAPAAMLPEASTDLKALALADSVALDPHKWLYSPLEAGCTLVRNPKLLLDAFSFHPEYYNFELQGEEPGFNYYELGMQNSRGFRALKVWLGLRQAGREGYIRMIRDDIALASELFRMADANPELEAVSHRLSITTFRFVPEDLDPGEEEIEDYLNELNRELLNRLQVGGEAFISNAVLNGKYLLRMCIVNFRTKLSDVEMLPELVVRIGRKVDREMRPGSLSI